MDVLIDKEENPENWEKLVEETKNGLEKAEELSPRRQEVLIEWAKFGLVANNFQLMKEKSQKCIELNSSLGDCYWYLGLSEILLGDKEEGEKDIEIAIEKDYRDYRLLKRNNPSEAS